MIIHKVKQSTKKIEYTEHVLCDQSIGINYGEPWSGEKYLEMFKGGHLSYTWSFVNCPICLQKKRGMRPRGFVDKNKNMKYYYYLLSDESIIRIYAKRKPSSHHIPAKGGWDTYKYCSLVKSWIGAEKRDISTLNKFNYIGVLK